MNTCVHTYTEPQTSSTRSCGLGRRIHGSVEDTKLSTNKQHSPSLQPRIRVRPVPAYRVRSCCVGGRRESERLRAMGAGRRCLAPRVGGGSWSSPPHCGVHLGVVSRGNLARTPDVAVVISLNLFLAPVDDTVTTHSKTQVTRGCGRMAGRSGQCLAAVRSLVCVDAGSGAASGGSFRPVDLVGSKVNPGSPMGQPWVPDFWGATVGSRTKIVNRGSPRPAFSFACAGQPDQIVNL